MVLTSEKLHLQANYFDCEEAEHIIDQQVEKFELQGDLKNKCNDSERKALSKFKVHCVLISCPLLLSSDKV